MRRTLLLGLLIAGGLAIGISASQRPDSREVPAIQKIRDNLYVIAGSDYQDSSLPSTGGNIGVFVTATGVVLVDAKNPGYGRSILDQVKSVTDKPVTMIISTHSHRDHSGSIPEFSPTVEVVAHENTRANMARTDDTRMSHFQGAGARFLPKRTFKDKLSLFSGKDQIELYYFGPGHTNGDAWVVFPAVRAMHSGDMYSGKRLGWFNPMDHASITAFPETLRKALAEIKDVDTIITGHNNDLRTWNDLREYREFYVDFIGKTQAAKKAGKSADEVIKTFAVPDRFKGYIIDPQRVKDNVEKIYSEAR